MMLDDVYNYILDNEKNFKIDGTRMRLITGDYAFLAALVYLTGGNYFRSATLEQIAKLIHTQPDKLQGAVRRLKTLDIIKAAWDTDDTSYSIHEQITNYRQKSQNLCKPLTVDLAKR